MVADMVADMEVDMMADMEDCKDTFVLQRQEQGQGQDQEQESNTTEVKDGCLLTGCLTTQSSHLLVIFIVLGYIGTLHSHP